MQGADTAMGTITNSRVDGVGAITTNPVPRYSMAATIDYHVITDQELDQLSRPETGVIGTIGFTAVGGTIGLLPGTVATLKEITDDTPTGPLPAVDLTTAILTPVCGTAAIICLVLFFIAKYRNGGLVSKIRKRPRRSGELMIKPPGEA